MNIMSRECHKCGNQNEEFFNMPIEARDAYVEFYHDRDVYRTMEREAQRQACTVEELYRRAAEGYLDMLAMRRKA
jgi:DNA/RNA-binding domain of Phe-tRNA-synthetase-like protein